MKNDSLLQQDVIAAGTREPTADAAGIGVEVHHPAIKLAGRLSSTTIKWYTGRVKRGTAVVSDIDATIAPPTDAHDGSVRVKDDKDLITLWNCWLGIPARKY